MDGEIITVSSQPDLFGSSQPKSQKSKVGEGSEPEGSNKSQQHPPELSTAVSDPLPAPKPVSESRFRSFQFEINTVLAKGTPKTASVKAKADGKWSGKCGSKRKGGSNWGNKRFRNKEDGPNEEENGDILDPEDAAFSTAKDKLRRVGEGVKLTEQQIQQRKERVQHIVQTFVEDTPKAKVEDGGKIKKSAHPAYCKPFEYVGPMQYGVATKTLGTKVGISKPFKPPVPGEEQSVSDPKPECPLPGIDPKLVELIESQIMSQSVDTSWEEIAGLKSAKKVLMEIIVLPFLRPEIFTGIRAPPKGVLLFGPPGTGKTMIGKCVASQAKATFFNITASSLTSKWVGEGEKLVRALFAVARLNLPAIIFIDEVDSLLSSRSDSEHESSRRIKTEFLVQLDGVCTAKDERLLVLGATNRPHEIDEAARRRFSKRLYIPLPDASARCDILKLLLKEIKHDMTDECLEKVASFTEGFSGADVHVLCKEAAMGPIRELQDIEKAELEHIRAVRLGDFEEGVESVRPSVNSDMLDEYAKWNKMFGSTSK